MAKPDEELPQEEKTTKPEQLFMDQMSKYPLWFFQALMSEQLKP